MYRRDYENAQRMYSEIADIDPNSEMVEVVAVNLEKVKRYHEREKQ